MDIRKIIIDLIKFLIINILIPWLNTKLCYGDKLDLSEVFEDLNDAISNKFDWQEEKENE